jgi:hypothetical protein
MMVLVVAMMAQLGSPVPQDSTYSTPAVRALVARAAASNRRVPDSLLTYRARVESEMAFIARQPDGTEQTFAIEQAASVVRWDRSGRYEQRIIGYRSQSAGFTVSAVGMFRQAWTIPVLYGNRIALLFGQPDTSSRGRARHRRRSDTTVAIHPFATDRERVYRFSGGDTVVTINPGGRNIPVVRVHVEPIDSKLTRRTAAFRGDVELDGRRAEIVRMRGYFVTLGARRSRPASLVASQIEAIAYVELENGEFEQRYWLPTSQRVEAQAAIALLGDQRAVFRVISRFRQLTVNAHDDTAPGGATFIDSARVARSARSDSTDVPDSPAPNQDTLRVVPHRLTFAPADSIDRFADWSRDIGELTSSARADDFADVAPDSWRSTGRPLARIRFQEPSDLVHYNRIEGAFTGIGAEAKMRDAAPGLVVRGNLGWAWAEQTVRGRASVERQSGRWWPLVRMGRSLDLTNDFREPFDSGSTIGALFSVDDYDYVDRHLALVGLTGFPTRRRDVRVRLEVGAGSDRYAPVRRARGPLAKGDSGFRFNRGVDAGRYRTVTVKAEIHPDVNAAFVRPGIGAVLQAQAASGDITWRRVELRLVGRRALGPIIYAAQLDAGAVTGDSIPPQQLFELGENQNLPGYGYKEFAGNRAAVLRGLAMYPLPFWQKPLRAGRWVFPGIAPTVSFGAQTGWAKATDDAARSAVARLGTVGDSILGIPPSVPGAPVSQPTDGIKTSIDFRFRFFGGAVSVGVARATDRHQSWRFIAGLAQVL